jgi:hypothetical protein
MQALRDLQGQSGAILEDETQIPLSFGNDGELQAALATGTLLCDRSHWGLLRLGGGDRLRFLHNQTTNAIQSLQAGQGCETVFVTSTGRTIDLVTVLVTENELLLLISSNRRQQLLDWMDRYLFPMDKVELGDLSGQYAIFTLIGDKSRNFLEALALESITDRPDGFHAPVQLAGIDCRVVAGTGLAIAGCTLLVPVEGAVVVWSALVESGATAIGDRGWEFLRIRQGRPVPDRELTEDYNPLEAGLWKAISFDKGCYIGQETIARLNTYKGVKTRLWGIALDRPVEPNTPLTLDGEKVGILTSCTETADGAIGLGYLRTKAGGEGLRVSVGEASGEIVAVPFLSHNYYEPKAAVG